MAYRIGTSGYQYRHWRESFYSKDVPQRRWLAYYAQYFNTVEINATFYRLPDPGKLRDWCESVPDDFRFALKFSRYGSHLRRLKEPEASIGPFRAMAQALGNQLGVVLLQLPPNWRAQPERLDAFLGAADWPWAVELRDPAWFSAEVFDVLTRHNAALCLTDATPEAHWRLTADWAYLRFHGGDHTEAMGSARIRCWSDWLRARLPEHRAAWLFCNNDGNAQAPADAQALQSVLAA